MLRWEEEDEKLVEDFARSLRCVRGAFHGVCVTT